MSKVKYTAGREAGTRLFEVHSSIQGGEYPNQKTLMRRFGVSESCAKRDIEHLRKLFPFKLVFDPKRNGYYYTGPARFPGLEETNQAEVLGLLIAKKALDHYKGTSLHKTLETAYNKMLGQLDQRAHSPVLKMEQTLSVRPLAPECIKQDIFEAVSAAAGNHKTLLFHYRKPGVAQGDFRTGDPYHLFYSDSCWYAQINDHRTGRIKTFLLSRMSRVSETGATFVRRPDFDPDALLKSSFGVMEGKGSYEVVIEFDAWGADQVRARTWHSSQEIMDLPGGGARLTMCLGGLEEITRWVVSWGPHATVIRPSALVERAVVWAKGFLGHHE